MGCSKHSRCLAVKFEHRETITQPDVFCMVFANDKVLNGVILSGGQLRTACIARILCHPYIFTQKNRLIQPRSSPPTHLMAFRISRQKIGNMHMGLTEKLGHCTWGVCTRRAGKQEMARSQLYRSQILQVNMRWRPLAEIYPMHSFAPFSNLICFVKNC